MNLVNTAELFSTAAKFFSMVLRGIQEPTKYGWRKDTTTESRHVYCPMKDGYSDVSIIMKETDTGYFAWLQIMGHAHTQTHEETNKEVREAVVKWMKQRP